LQLVNAQIRNWRTASHQNRRRSLEKSPETCAVI
jgi:hypothetical protein